MGASLQLLLCEDLVWTGRRLMALAFLLVCLVYPCAQAAPSGAEAPPFQWVAHASDTENIYANAVAVDPRGNSFITGFFETTAQFGGTNLVSNTSRNGYLAKYDPAGNAQWAVRFGDQSANYGYDVAVDHEGNCFVAGLRYSGRDSDFLTKYDPHGNFCWMQQHGGTRANGVAVDSQGNAYVVGVAYRSTRYQLFLAKYNRAGDQLWYRETSGQNSPEGAQGRGVAVDSQGNVYVVGSASEGVFLGTNQIPYLRFMAKLDTEGDLLWIRETGGDFSTATGVVTDAEDQVVLVGSLGGPSVFGQDTISGIDSTFMAKCSPSGEWLWAFNLGVNRGAVGLEVDSEGNIYIAGSYSGTLSVPGTPNMVLGGSGSFVMKFNGEGERIWTKATDRSTEARGVAVHGTDVFVAGVVHQSSTFDLKTIRVAGANDAYLGKLSPLPKGRTETIISLPTHVWKYNQLGQDLGTNWRLPEFDDSTWPEGPALLGIETTPQTYPEPFRVPLQLGPPGPEQVVTYYFRTTLEVPSHLLEAILVVTNFLDDGAVIFLNGAEISRIRLPFEPLQASTFAQSTLVEPAIEVGLLPTENLRPGKNTLAVEVHQLPANSSDLVFGMSLHALIQTNSPSILLSPQDRIVMSEQSAHFHVTADGAPPLHFQWYYQDELLLGATNAMLHLPIVRPASAGPYYAVVTNAYGAATSAVATLTVELPPGDLPLQLTVQGNGMVKPSPERELYNYDEEVQLSATPGPWHEFVQWSDGVTNNPRTITIGLVNQYEAIFSPVAILETLTIGDVSRTAPFGMPAILVDDTFVVTGAVMKLDEAEISIRTSYSPGAVFYSLDGSEPGFSSSLYREPFVIRRPATIRARAYDGHFADSWEADPVKVVIEPTFALHREASGGGDVLLSPDLPSYESNTVVTLTAAAESGWEFLQWLGDAEGDEFITEVVMDQKRCVTAVFGTAFETTVAGYGEVIREPDMPVYPHGTEIRLTAVPAEGHFFAAWGHSVLSTNNPLLYTVTEANPVISSAFASLPTDQVSMTLVITGYGNVEMSPHGNRFPKGQRITLTAHPDEGQVFNHWSGYFQGGGMRVEVILNESIILQAGFSMDPTLWLGPCHGRPVDDGFRLSLSGRVGGYYSVDASKDLWNWQQVGAVTNIFGSTQFTDEFPFQEGRRFYRLREE